ncbi:MAG: cache domain-containing protein [Spirochaetia bacterium]|jgi:methyl-accepting chemotaxis protein|nr:cache domain-containing protein [Spirochaetia bacterium]
MARFKKTIGTELSGYILITMILFLAAILVFSIKYISDFFIEVAEEQSMTVLYETDYKIKSFFNDIENLSESLINYSAVYEVRTAEMRELFISNVLARKKYLRAIYLGTKNGTMYEWGYGDGFIDYTPVFPEGYNPVYRPWYKTAIEKKTHSITNPYVYASINKIGITSVNPVYNKKTGGFTGVLGIDIMLDSMSGFLAEINITNNGKIVLLTDAGHIIASQYSGNKEISSSIHDILTENLKKMIEEHTGRFFTRLAGEDYFVIFKRSGITGWIIAISYPYSGITEGLDNTLFIISVVYLLLTIMLTFSLAGISRHLIVKPLENLVSVMKMIEAGNQDARADVTTENEFSILGAQFNRLFELVQEYSQCLEKKVDERTREVINLQHENTRLRIIEEKERIISELHDSIGAKLTNINICNNVAISLAHQEEDELLKMLKVTDDNCTNAMLELRDIVNGISRQNASEQLICFMEEEIPERLGLKNITAVIKWKVRKKIFHSKIKEDFAGELVKIMEELTSNILKHSKADNVKIEISIRKKIFKIIFKDNGIGFNPDITGSEDNGFGLKNIRQRIEKIGGNIIIQSKQGSGTVVIFVFPSAEANVETA